MPRALSNAIRGALGVAQSGAVSAFASSSSAVRTNVTKLQESAIEPLPQADRVPRPLRELEWRAKQDGRADPAGIIRRLRRNDIGPDEQNELGCAYALLAWEKQLDAHWLAAIKALKTAAADGDEDVATRAKANLMRVAEVSGFPP